MPLVRERDPCRRGALSALRSDVLFRQARRYRHLQPAAGVGTTTAQTEADSGLDICALAVAVSGTDRRCLEFGVVSLSPAGPRCPSLALSRPLQNRHCDWSRANRFDGTHGGFVQLHQGGLISSIFMQARLRRLTADYEQVQRLFAQHPYIQLLKTEGNPPDRYTFAINVSGLAPTGTETFVPSSTHQAEVFLPLDYPRRPPFCRMLTPVFHPNIDPQKICIGDHWSAGQSLGQMVIRIAEMICFQSYNLKSPLNAEAAAWVEKNISLLPLQKADLTGTL